MICREPSQKMCPQSSRSTLTLQVRAHTSAQLWKTLYRNWKRGVRGRDVGAVRRKGLTHSHASAWSSTSRLDGLRAAMNLTGLHPHAADSSAIPPPPMTPHQQGRQWLRSLPPPLTTTQAHTPPPHHEALTTTPSRSACDGCTMCQFDPVCDARFLPRPKGGLAAWQCGTLLPNRSDIVRSV